MSSRKNLKKQINESMYLLYADCILYKKFTQNPNIEKADEIIAKISDTHISFLSRVNASEGKEVKNRVKTYYKKLRKDLKSQIDDLGQQIQNLD